MIRITITSPSGKRRFTYEFAEIDAAKRLLDVLRVHGFEAAEKHVKGIDDSMCKICGKPKTYHIPGRHSYRPFAAPAPTARSGGE